MKLKVNDKELTIFEGAKVKDAVRMYYTQIEKTLPTPMPTVKDAYGNEVAEDGALSSGSILYIAYEKSKRCNPFGK